MPQSSLSIIYAKMWHVCNKQMQLSQVNVHEFFHMAMDTSITDLYFLPTYVFVIYDQRQFHIDVVICVGSWYGDYKGFFDGQHLYT